MVSARMKPRSKSPWITPAACGARRALADGPGAGLLGADGEVGLQAPEARSRRGSAGRGPASSSPISARNISASSASSWLISSSILAEITTDAAPSSAAIFGHPVRLGVAGRGRVLLDVADVKDRLGGQQLQHPPGLARPRRRPRPCAPACPASSAASAAFSRRSCCDRLLVAALASCAPGPAAASR